MPLGIALVIIYVCPVMGMLLTRLFPHKRFGKYASTAAPVMILVACFAFLPWILYTVRTKHSPEVRSNETHTNHTNDEDVNDKPANLGLYYLGVGMALLISVSDAAHKIIVGYLYGNTSTNSTILTTYLAGFGGIVVGLIAAIFDKNQNMLSERIASITPEYWGLLVALALLKLVTFLIINSAVKFARPLVVFLMKYRKRDVSKQ